ncbi:MAG: pyridoxamine 5'-phosphate oxidase family protein, partial [Microbacterium sp.]
MGKVFESIDDGLAAWIAEQRMFFVATAPLAEDGRVNVSPRGADSLSVLDDHTVAWLDLTGSGAETIAHLTENGRICLMFCSFDARPRIVRLHGHGRVVLPGEELFDRV